MVKGQEIEKKIFLILCEHKDGLGFNELCLRIRGSNSSIKKYLDKMVSEGTLHKEVKKRGLKGNYSLNQNIKNWYLEMHEKNENAIVSLEKVVEGFVAELETSKKRRKHSKLTKDGLIELFNFLKKGVIEWFNSYSLFMFRITSGIFPILLEKEEKRTLELQLKQIEILLKKVKEIHPRYYQLFLSFAERSLVRD